MHKAWTHDRKSMLSETGFIRVSNILIKDKMSTVSFMSLIFLYLVCHYIQLTMYDDVLIRSYRLRFQIINS